MRSQVLLFLVLYSVGYVGSLLIGILFNPVPMANILGFLALVAYVATLLPSLIKTTFPRLKGNKALVWLLKYRRHLGISAFGFGVNHGILLAIQRHLNFLDWHTYARSFEGLSTLTIFTILAVTSNDESVKKLKKNWRKLHQLTYLAIFLLPWHVLDKMSAHWTHLTPIAALITLTILVLFLTRKWLEWVGQKDSRKPNSMRDKLLPNSSIVP